MTRPLEGARGPWQDPPEDPAPGIEAPDQVSEGGVLEFEVHTGVTEVNLWVPGVGRWKATVDADGRVEWTLPTDVRGGHRIVITDMKLPNPSSDTVDVVGQT